MRISEIFYSVQGEGQLVGMPSIFVRTSGCNLRCAWCDTMYASWSPVGNEQSIPAIIEAVREFPSKYVVLTGGEPMVAKGIRELAMELRKLGYHITIETAGTIAPEGIECDLASISPKLNHSTPTEEMISADWISKHNDRRLNPEILQLWLDQYDYQLKFVTSGEDLDEIDDLLGKLGKVETGQVMLMPEGITTEQLKAKQEKVIAICKSRGFRFCPRIHIDLFGNTAGT